MHGRSMRERLAAQRRRALVGRVPELELVGSALAAAESPFAVLHVHGPGGVGKSALLRMFAELGKEAGRAVVRVDGHDVQPNPAALREAADGALSGRPGLLLLDSCELLAPLDPWIREEFLADLPAAVLVVIASRQPPAPGRSPSRRDNSPVHHPLDHGGPPVRCLGGNRPLARPLLPGRVDHPARRARARCCLLPIRPGLPVRSHQGADHRDQQLPVQPDLTRAASARWPRPRSRPRRRKAVVRRLPARKMATLRQPSDALGATALSALALMPGTHSVLGVGTAVTGPGTIGAAILRMASSGPAPVKLPAEP
jgi:hypothetical protein